MHASGDVCTLLSACGRGLIISGTVICAGQLVVLDFGVKTLYVVYVLCTICVSGKCPISLIDKQIWSLFCPGLFSG